MNKLVVTLFASAFSFFSCGAGTKTNDGGKSLNPMISYHYSEHGSMAQPEIEFTVSYVDDNNCQVIFFNQLKEDYSTNEDRDTVTAPVSLLKDIEKVVVEHKMKKYKERYRTMFDVLDGTSWCMEILYQDGSMSRSGGYMAWPHDDGIQIIKDLMRKQFKGL